MSMRRTLTKKPSQSSGFSRSDSKRKSIKNNISAPVALISTTNMLSYTSPSLRLSQSQNSLSSSSDTSPTGTKFPPSPLSASSGEDTDIESPRHTRASLSGIFVRPAAVPTPVRSQSTRAPPRPQQGHQRMPSAPSYPAPKPQPPKTLHSAVGLPRVSSQHPFGAELARVQELTEEMGLDARDEEVEVMMERGLMRWRASDYEREISGNVFEDMWPAKAGWI